LAPCPARLTEKSSPSSWELVSETVKLEVSLNAPAEPGANA
jgi:hypothetical protein